MNKRSPQLILLLLLIFGLNTPALFSQVTSQDIDDIVARAMDNFTEDEYR